MDHKVTKVDQVETKRDQSGAKGDQSRTKVGPKWDQTKNSSHFGTLWATLWSTLVALWSTLVPHATKVDHKVGKIP